MHLVYNLNIPEDIPKCKLLFSLFFIVILLSAWNLYLYKSIIYDNYIENCIINCCLSFNKLLYFLFYLDVGNPKVNVIFTSGLSIVGGFLFISLAPPFFMPINTILGVFIYPLFVLLTTIFIMIRNRIMKFNLIFFIMFTISIVTILMVVIRMLIIGVGDHFMLDCVVRYSKQYGLVILAISYVLFIFLNLLLLMFQLFMIRQAIKMSYHHLIHWNA